MDYSARKQSDIWQHLTEEQQTIKSSNFKTDQSWRALENRLSVMEVKLKKAKQIRDEYIRHLQNKYPSWTAPVRKSSYMTSLSHDHWLRNANPVGFLDRLATRKYWQLDDEKSSSTSSALAILQDLRREKENQQYQYKTYEQAVSSASDQNVPLRSHEQSELDSVPTQGRIDRREIAEMRADIAWIKNRLAEISLEIIQSRKAQAIKLPLAANSLQQPANDGTTQADLLLPESPQPSPLAKTDQLKLKRELKDASSNSQSLDDEPQKEALTVTTHNSEGIGVRFSFEQQKDQKQAIEERSSEAIKNSTKQGEERGSVATESQSKSNFSADSGTRLASDYKAMMGMISKKKSLHSTPIDPEHNSDADSVEEQIASALNLGRKKLSSNMDKTLTSSHSIYFDESFEDLGISGARKISSNSSAQQKSSVEEAQRSQSRGEGNELLAKLFPGGLPSKPRETKMSYFATNSDSDSDIAIPGSKTLKKFSDVDSDSDFFG